MPNPTCQNDDGFYRSGNYTSEVHSNGEDGLKVNLGSRGTKDCKLLKTLLPIGVSFSSDETSRSLLHRPTHRLGL